jgi:xanthine/CO dehydrogenase XdhC/CoxF family maturation factor
MLTTLEEQRPSEPEETNPIYRVVVAPVVANWETPRSRAPRPRPAEATTEGGLQSTAGEGVIERSVRRRVVTGLQSTPSECMHSGPPPTPVGSTPGGSVVVRAPRIAPSSRSTVALTGTSVGAPCPIITCRSVAVIFSTKPNRTR